jgi:hypothetical protein
MEKEGERKTKDREKGETNRKKGTETPNRYVVIDFSCYTFIFHVSRGRDAGNTKSPCPRHNIGKQGSDFPATISAPARCIWPIILPFC